MKLQTLEATAKPEDVLKALEESGAVIVENLIDHTVVESFQREVRPFVDRTPMGRDEFTGKGTKRTGALAARSATCRELILNDLVLATAESFLQPFTRKIQLHLTQTIEIHPGSAAQQIHRDRYAWGSYLPRSIEPQLNTIWAMTDFTEENGATHCVPGSRGIGTRNLQLSSVVSLTPVLPPATPKRVHSEIGQRTPTKPSKMTTQRANDLQNEALRRHDVDFGSVFGDANCRAPQLQS